MTEKRRECLRNLNERNTNPSPVIFAHWLSQERHTWRDIEEYTPARDPSLVVFVRGCSPDRTS